MRLDRHSVKRRQFLAAGASAGAAAFIGVEPACASEREEFSAVATFKHSVTRWPYKQFTLDQLAIMARELGLSSVELLEPDEWAITKRNGLTCAMGYATVPDPGARLTRGFNRAEHHSWLVPAYERAIPLAAAAGVPNVICFSGNRDGLDDAAGLATCAQGLAPLIPLAERHGVTLCMELLNSRQDHPDYQCDHTAWGVEVVSAVDSSAVKLLYDVYHMQIMEGDIIRTIADHGDAFAHYHVAGNPGRNEPDLTQELWYPAIYRAIGATGFEGYVGMEFIPRGNPLMSLQAALDEFRAASPG